MRIALILVVLACLGGCATAAPWVELGGQRFTVEVADDFEERARGLMFRDHLPADHGMLFVHAREEPLAYWMKNTRIPLDILYFDAEQRLVSVRMGVPPCSAGNACPAYPSDGPAKYVLELTAGRASTLGLERGATLTLAPGIPRTGTP